MKYLGDFLKDATAALMEEDPHKACLHWQNSLGNRFTCHDYKQNNTTSYDGLISGAGSSKPWMQI